MAEFRVTLINEIEKLHKNKKALAAVILSIILIVFGQVSILIVRKSFGIQGGSSSEFPLLVLSMLTNTILPLFTALITIDSFSGEFSQNTMKIALTKPVTRLKLLISKIAAIMLFTFMTLMLVMIFSIISGLIFNTNSFTLGSILKIMISYIVTLIPMTVLCLMIILFANILKNGIAVFFLSTLVFIVFKITGAFFPVYSGILFTSMMNWYNLWIMDNIPFLKILNQFMMLLSYAIIFFTAAYYLFDKKEI
ncbi:ABC transporter permease [Clostridium sp. JNZ X4-2]